MLALSLALAVATAPPPALDDVVTPPPPAAHEAGANHWRVVAFGDPLTGALGLEAPAGPLYFGVAGFAGFARSATSATSATTAPNTGAEVPTIDASQSMNAGAVTYLQGRFLELPVVDVSWALRLRGGASGYGLESDLGEHASTALFLGASAGVVGDARIVDGVRLRVGVDVLHVFAGIHEISGTQLNGAGDDWGIALLVPQAGLVVDLF